MDEEEQQRLLRFVFRGIRASYDRKTGLSMSFEVRPEWQPYVDAVLAAEKRPPPEAPIVAGPERETGPVRAVGPWLLSGPVLRLG